MLLRAVFIITVLHFKTTDASSGLYFKSYRLETNPSVSVPALKILSSSSVIACSIECVNVIGCVVISFQPVSKTCIIGGNVSSAPSFHIDSSSGNWSVFIMEGNGQEVLQIETQLPLLKSIVTNEENVSVLFV